MRMMLVLFALPALCGNFEEQANSGIDFHHAAFQTAKKYMLEIMGSGLALLDYDRDGRLDVFLVNGAPITDPMPVDAIPRKSDPRHWHRLYRQKSDGRFEDVTEKAGVQGIGYGLGAAVGDYDNDGFPDLYVTEYGGNRLYHNNGDGTFRDVTEISGTGGSGWSSSAAWVDLDQDGRLDLVVLRYVEWDFRDRPCFVKEALRAYCSPDAFRPIAPLVFHNDGGGRFSEVGRKIGLSKPGKGLGIALADADGDGRIDLYVSNDTMPGFYYHNRGDGTFEEMALLAGLGVSEDGRTYAGMGNDFTDYDNDGRPDIAVADLALEMYALYRNLGKQGFEYTARATGLANLTLQHSGMGLRFLDYDNDGWKDLLISQGHVLDTISLVNPNLHYREPLMLLRNTGRGFADVSAESGAVFREPWAGRGLALGDLDDDGRLDVVVSTSEGPAHVVRNRTRTDNHWLTLNLIGTRSNRDGIGAEVRIRTSQGLQMATASTASSYLSSGDKRVHFGLGKAGAVDALEIHWPSGRIQTLRNVPGDRVLEVREP